MTRRNFRLILNAFLQRTPFRPFTLELASGSRMEVNHPEALTLYEQWIVCASTRGTRSVFEYASVVRFIDATGTV
jgi:hypothetical protein